MVKRSGGQMASKMINLTERLVDPSQSPVKHVETALAILVPILLEKGIEVKAKIVQALGIYILVKICQRSGRYLRPHLEGLMKILLQGLSSLEPAEFMYLATQDHGAEFSDNVESARLQFARMNPLNGALDSCTQLLDEQSVDKVLPELTSMIRGGVGIRLNSINAACNILIELCGRKELSEALQKHSKRVINALCNQLPIASSPHLRQLYCKCLGHWCAISKKKYVDQVTDMAQSLYFDDSSSSKTGDSVPGRLLSGMLVCDIGKYGGTLMQKYPKVLGLGLVGVYDSNDEVAKKWTEAMEESGGRQMFVSRNLDIGIEIILQCLHDQTYERKLVCLCAAIKAISGLVQVGRDDLDKKLLSQLVGELSDSLSGRIWEGKTELFSALIHVSKYTKQ
ncbi:hypothetical protein RFI_11274, partial [Reticulomyxa filosa]